MSSSFPSHIIPFPRDNHGHQFLDVTFHRYFYVYTIFIYLPEIFYANIGKYVYFYFPYHKNESILYTLLMFFLIVV